MSGMTHHQPFQNAGDISLAGGLATSPAWAPWLDSVNEVLTTGTLLIGLVLGLARLWVAFKDWRATNKAQPPG